MLRVVKVLLSVWSSIIERIEGFSKLLISVITTIDCSREIIMF